MKLEIRGALDSDLSGVLRVLADSGIDGGYSFTLEEARADLERLRV